nr:TonB-dependent siderophore receptor [Janthinobacterium sp. Marseille]
MTVNSAYAQEAAVRTYTVPAGSLTSALNRFGRDAGIMLSFSSETTNKLQSKGLNGSYTITAGLQALLAGSGLEAVRQANGGYTLQASLQSSQQDAVLAPVTVRAQADETTEGSGSYTTRATGAGTRMSLSLRETPQSVSVISRQQMDDQNLVTLTDVLRQTPGIVVDRVDERVLFTSRGFDLSPMINGIPTLAFNSVAGESGLLSTAIYDRVEVVRGAAGLLNGVGSPGGSINLVRKRPTSDFSGRATVGLGSWNQYNTEIDLSNKLNAAGTVRGRVVGSYTDGDNFIDYKQRRENVFYGAVEADIAPDTIASVGYEFQKNSIKGGNFGQAPLFFSDGSRTNLPRTFNSSTPWSSWDVQQDRFFLNLEHKLNNGWSIKAEAAQTKNKRDRVGGDIWLYPSDVDAATGNASIDQGADQARGTNKSFDVFASGPFELFGRTHSASLGLNVNRYSYSVAGALSVPAWPDQIIHSIYDLRGLPRPDFKYSNGAFGADTTQTAVYGSTRLKPTDNLAILLGGRLTWYRNTDWNMSPTGEKTSAEPNRESSVFTPYAGIVYDLNKEYSAYASYTDIFQPNTVRDSSNSVLDPKRGRNLELGLKGEHWDGRLNTSLAVFQTDEDNVAVVDAGAPLLPDGTAPSRAVKGARSKGFELTASGELARGWQVMGGYTYFAKRDAEKIMLNTTLPRRLLRIATSYRLPGSWSKLIVGGNVSYQSEISYDEYYGLGSSTQGGLTLLGLMARYEIDKNWSAALNIENVTDKYYYSGLGGYNGYTYGNPRNAWLKLSYKF